MRKRRIMPGWRAFASRYCCIIGVVMAGQPARGRRGGKCLQGTPSVAFRDSNGTPRRAFPTAVLLLAVAEDLGHAHRVAALVELDRGHVVAHEHEAASAGAFEVL